MGKLMPVRPPKHDGATPAWLRPFDQDAEEQQQVLEEQQRVREQQLQEQQEQNQHLVEEGEEDNAGVDELADPREGRRPAGLRAPLSVSQAEREEHELTHIPYRQWCPVCVRARGRATPHRSRTEQEKREGGTKHRRRLFLHVDRWRSSLRKPSARHGRRKHR